ncbi:MAG: hypothetical protein IH865_04810 [Chloroflexi bacterium]|nr:hypothetical protein [Chloroflexota bacterium]
MHDALKITLLWEDNSDDEQQFVLERSSAGPNGPWGIAALVPADSTTYNDSGLNDNVTYWYRIAATNAAGTSDYSNVASGTATDLPMPPPGDADCNGTVTSVDAALVLQFDAGLFDILVCSLLADANQDGTVNSVDASLILQLVAGLIDDFDGPPHESGVRGLVTIGPICPVMQEDVPCPDLPFSAKIVIENDVGTEVASVVSGDDGLFQIELDPGSYVLVPASPNPGAPPFAEEQAVRVLEDEFAEVLIQYDSGIR